MRCSASPCRTPRLKVALRMPPPEKASPTREASCAHWNIRSAFDSAVLKSSTSAEVESVATAVADAFNAAEFSTSAFGYGGDFRAARNLAISRSSSASVAAKQTGRSGSGKFASVGILFGQPPLASARSNKRYELPAILLRFSRPKIAAKVSYLSKIKQLLSAVRRRHNLTGFAKAIRIANVLLKTLANLLRSRRFDLGSSSDLISVPLLSDSV